jgi:pimeloyl-ACP methyl ester carboxylesterase
MHDWTLGLEPDLMLWRPPTGQGRQPEEKQVTLYHNLTEEYLTTQDGMKIRYLKVAGSGRPVVLVHGLAVQNSGDQWLSSMEALSKLGPLYAIDMPGWGASDMPESGYSFPMWIGAIDALVKETGADEIDLIGQSLGGWFAAVYANQNQDKVRRLALLSNAGLNPSPPNQRSTFNLPSREQIRNLEYVTPEMADAIYDQMDRPGRAEAYANILDYINDPAVREEWGPRNFLADMKMPILFGQADTNRAIKPEFALEGYKLAPHGRLVITMGGSAPGGYNTPELIAASIRFFQMDEVPLAH